MPGLRGLLLSLRALVRRDAVADEIRAEMQFHLDMRATEYQRRGLEPEDASRAARRRFGNPAATADEGFDVRGGGFVETVLQDLKYGVRQLRKQPSFSIIAILTLACSTGVATALFSVIDAALVRTLPYPHPEQLVIVEVEEVRTRSGEPGRLGASMADLRAWRALPGLVSEAGMGRVIGFQPLIVETTTIDRFSVGEASEGFLETYGVTPILGRGFQPEDTRVGAPGVALLGHAYWRQQFGGDANALGRVIRIQNNPVMIVGVLPPGFFNETALWQPATFNADFLWLRGTGMDVIARLPPGVTLEQAAAAMTSVSPKAANQSAGVVRLTPMYDFETKSYGPTLWTLGAAVALILVIACVNVAGLLLARGATRDIELAIRRSIGAGRGRLLRQLITESLLLAAAGAVLGVLFAWMSLDALVSVIPLSLPMNSPATINPTVLAFAVALTGTTAMLFGIFPALKLARASTTLNRSLAEGGRGKHTHLSRRSGQWLIGIEIAVALVLLTGSGLVVRSFARLVSSDLGFDPTRVFAFEVEPVDQAAAARREFYRALVTSARELPGIEAAGAIERFVLGGGSRFSVARADTGKPLAGPQRVVLPGYFEAMGLRPVAGRLLNDTDLTAGDAVVVNASLASRFFEGNAVGHSVTFLGSRGRTVHIVGVVPDARLDGPEGRVGPEMFKLPDPNAVDDFEALALVMRPRDGVPPSHEELATLVRAIDPRTVIGRVLRGTDLVGELIVRPRHRTLLFGLLGGFGLGLTLVGIFSMTAYAVARRTREIAVRRAFGARAGDVVRRMVADAAWPVVLGVVVGLGGAYYTTKFIEAFLFETTARDAATLTMAATLLALTACVAAWVPARRAAKVEPMVALRTD